MTRVPIFDPSFGRPTSAAPAASGPAQADKFGVEMVDRLMAGRLGFLGVAKECLYQATGRYPSADPDTIARAALGDPEARRQVLAADVPYSTPGDFPNILSAAANKILESPPDYALPTFKLWAHQLRSVPDFKPSTLVRFGEFGEFPHHEDGDDFEQSELLESCGHLVIESFGDEFALTPKMIVDDDAGAFLQALADKKAAHDQTLNALCLRLLAGNAETIDGVALFHADHANLRTPGDAPDLTELAAMRLLLRQQTGLSGHRPAGLGLDLLLVPSALETDTEVLIRSDLNVYPTNTADANPFRGHLTYAVEPGLDAYSATAYYGFARPSAGRSIVYCYQTGFESMKTRNYFNPQNNCQIWQFEGRFAAAVNDYRGVVKNEGTGGA